MKNDPAPMATIPAAKPSKPSMRFTACVMPNSHNTVKSGTQSSDNTNTSRNGKRNWNIVTPNQTSEIAATTSPVTFAGGEMSRMSSNKPRAKVMLHATTTPMISVLSSNSASKSLIKLAPTMPAKMPTNIPIPPTSGVGTGCIRRSSGVATHF